jgi:hypothetical protein
VHGRYISKYNQQDATLHNLFISVKFSTSAHHQELKTADTALGTSQTFTAACRYRGREK